MKDKAKELAVAYSIKRKAGPKKMTELPPQDETEHFDSITDAIRHKMNLKKMAEGGMVDEDESSLEEGQVDIYSNAQEIPNQYYGRNKEILKENYDSDLMDVKQPMNSNLKGDAREDATEDRHDMISSIRRKMKQMR